MTDSTPRTLLSFIYNTTGVAAYRREMHLDMRDAFARFGISDGAVREACYEVEEAAYELRTNSTDRLTTQPTNVAYWSAAKAKMLASSKALFEILSGDLTSRIVNPGPSNAAGVFRPAVDVDPDKYAPLAKEGDGVQIRSTDADYDDAYLLLDFVYFFFHYPDLQKPILTSAGLENALEAVDKTLGPGSQLGRKARAALGALIGARGAAKEAQIKACTDDVCTALAQEYCDRANQECW